jgi:hypothetical protein
VIKALSVERPGVSAIAARTGGDKGAAVREMKRGTASLPDGDSAERFEQFPETSEVAYEKNGEDNRKVLKIGNARTSG